MQEAQPVTMLVHYYPREGKEAELLPLIERHWPTLHRLGLSTDTPAQLWRATDKRSGRAYFVELFQWREASSSAVAHETPEVMAIWEPMGPILENIQLAQLDAVPAR